MGIKEFLKKLLFGDVQDWAYGLECEICKKSFISAEAHMKYVNEQQTEAAHNGKIPVLRR